MRSRLRRVPRLFSMVFLRTLVPSDVAVYARWGLDRRLCEHAGWTVDLPLSGYEAHWEKLVNDPPPNLIRLAAVDDDEVVGYADLHGYHPDLRELGYVVGPSSRWGQGIGTTIAHLGLAHGFETLGLQEITAEAMDANHASIHILHNLGMTETGRGQDELFLGKPSFYRQFSITRDEWTIRHRSN
jgi:RimJ/RimL family protein N-acetyltransferase